MKSEFGKPKNRSNCVDSRTIAEVLYRGCHFLVRWSTDLSCRIKNVLEETVQFGDRCTHSLIGSRRIRKRWSNGFLECQELFLLSLHLSLRLRWSSHFKARLLPHRDLGENWVCFLLGTTSNASPKASLHEQWGSDSEECSGHLWCVYENLITIVRDSFCGPEARNRAYGLLCKVIYPTLRTPKTFIKLQDRLDFRYLQKFSAIVSH